MLSASGPTQRLDRPQAPTLAFSYRQVTREEAWASWTPPTACPRAPRQPLTLHYLVTQRFGEAKPQGWASELLGAVQEGMPSTPSRHLAPSPLTPHFSHTQQWGPGLPSYTQERQDQVGTPRMLAETWEGQG